MGLFDSGPLSSPDAQIAMAAGLLSGTGNFGANLSKGLLAAQTAGQQERLNRANDLQQIQGLYKIALQNDQLQASYDDEAGRPHVRDPNLNVLEGRMAQLAGMPPLAGQGPVASVVPPMPQGSVSVQQTGAMPMPGMAPPSASPMASPDYQPPQAQVQQRTAANTQQMVDAVQAQMAALRRQGDRYAIMGFPTIAQERYKLGTPALSRGVSFNQATGLPMAGFVDNVPVKFDANGNPQVIQSDIPQAIANRAGMVTSATEGAKAPYTFKDVTQASGAVVPMSVSQLMNRPTAPTQSPQQQIPQSVINADKSGQPFSATQTPDGQVTFQQGGSNDPWATMPKVQAPQGIGQTTSQKQIDILRADKISKLSDELDADAKVANTRKAFNNQALDLLGNADTGYFANHIAQFRNVLASLGVKSAADQAATDQVLGKDLINTALQKGKQLFGSRFTQSEVGIMLSQANPSPQMQSVAIKFLLDSDNAMQDYALQKGDDFGRFLNGNGDPLQFSRWYDKTFPMSKTLEKVVPPGRSTTASARVRRFNPQTGKIED